MALAATDIETRSRLEALLTTVQFVKGVGPNRAALLNRLGIQTVHDLLWHLPRMYRTQRAAGSIGGIRPGEKVAVQGTLRSMFARRPRGPSRVRNIIEGIVDDNQNAIRVVWFNQPYLQKKLHPGIRVRLFGKTDLFDGFLQMTSPEVEVLEDDEAEPEEGRIVPLYRLTEGLTQRSLRNMVANALDKHVPPTLEYMPLDILASYSLPTFGEAIRVLHQPEPDDGVPTVEGPVDEATLFDDLSGYEPDSFRGTSTGAWVAARRRLIFEEFFQLRWLLTKSRSRIRTQPGIQHPPPQPDPIAETKVSIPEGTSRETWPARFLAGLPFELTRDQRQVLHAIQKDMLERAPMNRLLQGEVGSGKTIVAFYSLVLAAAGGHQAAMMVPTEILTEQHLHNLLTFKKHIPELSVAVLRGSMRDRERRPILEALASGSLDIVIGTHALFEQRIEFHRLGLVVIDEQHKFGVEQRSKLVAKGTRPDLLLMTATPIPRTLALTWYGDMDTSEIHELPAGRPPIKTRWTTWGKIDKVWEFLDEKLNLGQQAYVVCPAIEASDDTGTYPSAEEFYELLAENVLSHRRVALLHGRFKADERSAVMQALVSGDIDVVVATTVVEVGVDLPKATVMIVLGADRFGLAQLHQLRGRVGRGTEKSYCVLVTQPTTSQFAKKRLKALEASRDGFHLAEEDLRLRGPGELFGVRQSGLWSFRVADPSRHVEWLNKAQRAAAKLYEDDPRLQSPQNRPFGFWQDLRKGDRHLRAT